MNDRVWGGRGADRGADRLRGGSTGTLAGYPYAWAPLGVKKCTDIYCDSSWGV